MTRAHARATARQLLEIMPLVIRTLAAELRASGELPAPAHFALLSLLNEQPRTLSELAAMRGVSLPSMSTSIAALVHRGWIRRTAPAADRRVVILEVTVSGRAALERVARGAESRIADVLAPLDHGARRHLQAGLHVLQRVFAAPPVKRGLGRGRSAKGGAALRNRSEKLKASRNSPALACVYNGGDMTGTIAAAGASDDKGLLARVIGVLVAPRATFAQVAARPRWLGALALVVIATAAGAFLFLSTEVGQTAAIDQQIGVMESFGRRIPDAQYERLETMGPYLRYIGAANQLVALPVVALAAAGIIFALFTAILGGDATFKQVFAVVAHSGVVILVQQLFSLPLDYARETLSSPTSLSVFAPFLDDASFGARLLGSIDLFVMWWVIVLAIGLGVLYRRRTGPIALAMLAVYAAVAVVIAAIRAAVS
jgi:DNA-binding MarR family transcriptional regulator